MTENRKVSVIHQILVLAHIDFENESIYGYTELTLAPNTDDQDIQTIYLNCKQCKIYCIAFNGTIEADFEYCDPSLMKPCNDETKRDLQTRLFQDELCRISVDAYEGNGELCITVPDSIRDKLKQKVNVKLAVEFSIEKPTGGIRFITNKGYDEPNIQLNSYLFTIDNNSSFWFPCVQSYNEPCTWKLEITVDEELTVIASGNLIETEIINADMTTATTPPATTATASAGTTEANDSSSQLATKKKCHYYLSQPTCAPNIGLVIGRFDTMIDENMNEISYYYEHELKNLIKSSTSFLHEVYEFYEELLSVQFPYLSNKFVFVYDVPEDYYSYASLSIFNLTLLHSKSVIDQAIVTRRILANSVARQFFGCFITMFSWHNWWLITGISSHLTNLYFKKLLGNNEYKYIIYQDMKDVCAYEKEQGYILLDLNSADFNAKDNLNKSHILLKNPLNAAHNYIKMAEKKAHLVIRLIDDHIGRESMMQLLNKILSEAINSSNQKYSTRFWSNLSISSEIFSNLVSSFLSKDIKFIYDYWVTKPGCARFSATYTYNRKKNSIELDLKQDMINQKGYRKYIGPITIIVQELDGSFSHSFQVEDNVSSKFEISLHSKGKKSKKKKIPLITGEEVDIDTTLMDTDSAVLWIRIDPDMKIIREIKFEQQDHQWQHQLKYERDIGAQLDAIEALVRFPNSHTRSTLISVIETNECFYRVRIQSSYMLAEVANKMVHTWNGPLPLISTFKKFFMSPSAPNLVASNNFSDLQQYFIQKNLPIAMGNLRTSHNVCPTEIIRFILDLVKYNENSKNTFSDAYYRASLVDALANTLTASIASLQNETFSSKSANLSTDMYSVIEDIILRFNLEKLIPSYRYVISCSCLRALRRLQKLAHIPEDVNIFKEYAESKVSFDDIRMCAFEILVEFLPVQNDESLINFLLDSIENDHSYSIKFHIIQHLCKNAPFKPQSDETSKSSENLVNRLWSLMTKFSLNYRLKAGLAELYQILYGFSRPKCIKHAKETIKLSEVIEAFKV